jgi:transglutaminase-like putative cysteine protease
MFKRCLLFFLLSTFYYLLFPLQAKADEHFDISVESKYKISESGITTINQTIHIKNKTEFYYTPTYTVSVGFSDIENISAFNSDGTIATTLNDSNPSNKSIKLTFPKRYAGLGDTNTFTLQFNTKDIAKKQGGIWEVSIPGIKDPSDFTTYTTNIIVPESFGMASIIKPQISSTKSKNISLTKDEVGKSGVYILYGDKQYYNFSLKYNISNPNLFPVRTEIALPPQTNYQNVLINSFSVEPLNVSTDQDGNWIAEYRLLPQQKEQVIVNGIVEILPQPTVSDLSSVQYKEYTSAKKYWDISSPKVRAAVQNLKTPEDIYNFVVKTLSYNYSKVATDNERLGGSGALSDPKNSVCLEFTDLFVTLARAAGIPARSVEGFAYTQNSKLRPLSLVNDILHAWPEYYDKKTKRWIMVDPTWGSTTKGMDYFTTLDFSHIAFVIKGKDSEYPIPAGGYKFDKESKDVEVKFAQAKAFTQNSKITITDTFPTFSFPKFKLQGTFQIKNNGNSPLTNATAFVKTSKGTYRQFIIDYLAPGGTQKITTSFNDIPFLTNSSYLITIQVRDTTYSKKVRISFIPDLQLLLLIGGIIGGSTIIAAITFHTGSVLLQRRKR